VASKSGGDRRRRSGAEDDEAGGVDLDDKGNERGSTGRRSGVHREVRFRQIGATARLGRRGRVGEARRRSGWPAATLRSRLKVRVREGKTRLLIPC
jgi:hypothetical protein